MPIKVDGKNGRIYVKIQLGDECNSGHQDFSITGGIYRAPNSRLDRYFVLGGCIHESIVKHFPEFAPFVPLHLCDYKGAPIHTLANMFFRLREGFYSLPPDHTEFPAKFCEYYRITPKQFARLSKCQTEKELAVTLQDTGVVALWEMEVQAAIKLLEDLTGDIFKVDSRRTNFVIPE